MIYIITDTHLYHENIKKYSNRPDNFEKLIRDNWIKTVTDKDTVIHLGDITFQQKAIKEIGSYSGRKILIRGNHDRESNEFYLENGFILVAEELVLDMNRIRILFTHRPKFNHSADINIHGHQHNLSVYDSSRLYFPMSIEHAGYKPIALSEEFLNKLKKFVVDKRQPTLKEIMNLNQNAIGKPSAKDFYDGWADKDRFVETQNRIKDCYQILNNEPYIDRPFGDRHWRLAQRYIEGKISKKELINLLNNI